MKKLLLLVFLVFVGCGNVNLNNNSIPNWFYSPPKNSLYLYGSGEGNTPQQAKNNALNFIAGEIQTTISSSFVNNEIYTNNDGKSSFYKNIQNKIKTNIQKIDFTNIEIVKTKKIGNEIYMLVRVNKQQLFKFLKTKFDLLNSQIMNEIEVSKNYSLLEKFLTINSLKTKIEDGFSQLKILSVLNPNFNSQQYINRYNAILKERVKLLHQISFQIVSKDIFTQKLIEILNKYNYKISQHSNIKIILTKKIVKSNPMGMSVVKVNINIQVISNSKVLKSTSIEVKGISNNYQQALIDASDNFKNKIETMGIMKLLGV